jgi:alpha-N-arabinofuranosidase
VQAELGLRRPTRLCIDEWGIWEVTYRAFIDQVLDTIMRKGITSRAGIDNSFEETYDLKDALTAASWLHVMWRHPEKIAIGCLAQMVNAIAPITTQGDEVLRQTIFYPIAIARECSGPLALDVQVRTDEGVPAPGLEAASLPALDAGGTTDGSRVHLSFVNRSRDDELIVTVEGIGGSGVLRTIYHDDPLAQNTFENPQAVVPRTTKVDASDPLVLAPHSHSTLTID